MMAKDKLKRFLKKDPNTRRIGLHDAFTKLEKEMQDRCVVEAKLLSTHYYPSSSSSSSSSASAAASNSSSSTHPLPLYAPIDVQPISYTPSSNSVSSNSNSNSNNTWSQLDAVRLLLGQLHLLPFRDPTKGSCRQLLLHSNKTSSSSGGGSNTSSSPSVGGGGTSTSSSSSSTLPLLSDKLCELDSLPTRERIHLGKESQVDAFLSATINFFLVSNKPKPFFECNNKLPTCP